MFKRPAEERSRCRFLRKVKGFLVRLSSLNSSLAVEYSRTHLCYIYALSVSCLLFPSLRASQRNIKLREKKDKNNIFRRLAKWFCNFLSFSWIEFYGNLRVAWCGLISVEGETRSHWYPEWKEQIKRFELLVIVSLTPRCSPHENDLIYWTYLIWTMLWARYENIMAITESSLPHLVDGSLEPKLRLNLRFMTLERHSPWRNFPKIFRQHWNWIIWSIKSNYFPLLHGCLDAWSQKENS